MIAGLRHQGSPEYWLPVGSTPSLPWLPAALLIAVASGGRGVAAATRRALAPYWCTRTKVESAATSQSSSPLASASACARASSLAQVPSALHRVSRS